MAKTLFGGLLGGFAMYLIGFLFWGTPLNLLAFNHMEDGPSTALQASLAQTLTETGTGTYVVPAMGTAAGAVLYGKGPVAVVHFNSGGFPAMDTNSLVQGLILALFTGVLIALALGTVGARVTDFASRARLAVLFALAGTVWTELGQPIFNHYGWVYWVYLFISDFVALSVAGLIVARWFLPKAGLR